jgi:hypothetical protein
MIFRIANPLSRRGTKEEAHVEILPPEQLRRIERDERAPADEVARRVANKAGSIIGGTVAGFASGVAKHTVTPIAHSVTATARGVVGFVKSILIGVFIIVLAAIGLLAIVIASAPRR